jgi:uncharacterized membrane protein YfcA
LNWVWDLIAGALTGVLSAWGIGGGSLLMVYMTGFAGFQQAGAQGINLLYFLPASAGGLISHIKNGLVDRKTAVCAICAGLVSAALAALLANIIQADALRRLFGVFLLYIGFRELF